MKLAEYNYSISHIKGEKNMLAYIYSLENGTKRERTINATIRNQRST